MMRACVLHGIGDLRYEDVALAALPPGQVRMRVCAAGICGSDMPRVFEKGTYRFPTIPGHEFAGVIEAVADEENAWLVGKRAAVFPLLPCRECWPCAVGEYASCENYDYYGSRRDGGFAEYLNVNVWNLVIVPDSMEYELAAMCEPCAVALHALGRAGVGFGDTVAISGAGTIGVILAQLARAGGASKVILLDVDRRKLEFAKSMGFPDVLDSAGCDAAEAVRGMTGGKGADISIEGAGAAASLRNCVRITRNFGRIVLMGNPAGAVGLDQKDYWEILRKQLTLSGTWNSGYSPLQNDWAAAVSAISGGKVNLKPLITHRFPLERCVEAFNTLKDGREFVLKVMFINER